MATTLAFLNFKGGVAKTSSTVNLGSALAAEGQRVLLVDCDPQSHLAQHLGIAQQDITEGVEDVLRKRQLDIRPVVLTTSVTNLFLAPSTNAMANARAELATRPMRESLLQRALKPMANEVDWILIDSPPDEGLLSINALYACDSLIIPTTLDGFSVSSLPKVLAIRESLAEAFGRTWPVLGALICRFDRRLAAENRRALVALDEVMLGHGGVLQTRIRTDESVKQAQSLGMTLDEFATHNRRPSHAAADYRQLAHELQRRLPLPRCSQQRTGLSAEHSNRLTA